MSDATIMRAQNGFTLPELLIAMTILLLVLLAVIGVYSQGEALATAVDADSMIQNNARLAMENLERNLRMIGFGVPTGIRIGSTTLWTPWVFHASPTEIGFRAEIDGGNAEITCTPKTTNSTCPATKLRLDRTAYHAGLNCKQPDDATLKLPLVLVDPNSEWLPVDCNSVDTGDSSLAVAAVTNARFTAGRSQVFTIEQVYYRYVASATQPYGVLERMVRYRNQPDNAFPPSPTAWTEVASYLTNFSLEYRDQAGNVLTGNPLSAANRALVTQIVLNMEGYDQIGARGATRRIKMRSQLLVRNAAL